MTHAGSTTHDIGAISFSHRNTTLAERDMLAFSADEIAHCLPQLRQRLGGEVGIVSTCNRTEVYAYGPHSAKLWRALGEPIARLKGVDLDALPEPAAYRGAEAARHLFRVASSLESLALGEDQILAQVKDAHALLLRADDLKSPALDQLFQFAVRAGKRVRTETLLCQGNVSMSSVSVDLARKIFGHFKRTTILLVGAGETCLNAATHFRAAGAREFIVVNRSPERGERVARDLGGQYVPLHKLSDACIKADIAVFATGATTPLLDRESVRNVMKARRSRQLFILDISNPRNVAPEVEQQEGVFLFNIDHLDTIVQENLRGRMGEIPRAEQLIEEYVSEWDGWLRARRVTPTISAVARYYNEVRVDHLETYRHKVDPQTFATMEEFSRKLIRKLQHTPIAYLRERVADDSLRAEDLSLALGLLLPTEDDPEDDEPTHS